jgi:hypothetical protein
MTPHALGLSSAQINLVMDAAEKVQPAWRQRFLEAITDYLMGISQNSVVTNYDVSDAILRVNARIRVPASRCRGG